MQNQVTSVIGQLVPDSSFLQGSLTTKAVAGPAIELAHIDAG
jgi:hypothetical protein